MAPAYEMSSIPFVGVCVHNSENILQVRELGNLGGACAEDKHLLSPLHICARQLQTAVLGTVPRQSHPATPNACIPIEKAVHQSSEFAVKVFAPVILQLKAYVHVCDAAERRMWSAAPTSYKHLTGETAKEGGVQQRLHTPPSHRLHQLGSAS